MSATRVTGGCLLWYTPSVSCDYAFLSLGNKNAGVWQGRVRLDREEKPKMLRGEKGRVREMQTSCPGKRHARGQEKPQAT